MILIMLFKTKDVTIQCPQERDTTSDNMLYILSYTILLGKGIILRVWKVFLVVQNSHVLSFFFKEIKK